jgi:hypothetical protein
MCSTHNRRSHDSSCHWHRAPNSAAAVARRCASPFERIASTSRSSCWPAVPIRTRRRNCRRCTTRHSTALASVCWSCCWRAMPPAVMLSFVVNHTPLCLHVKSPKSHTYIANTSSGSGSGGGGVRRRAADGQTPLHHACAFGHLGTAAALLRRGAELEAIDARGKTPLAAAVRAGSVPGVAVRCCSYYCY